MEEKETIDPAVFGPGLRKVRRRRWYLWTVILVYLPTIWTSLEITQSDKKTAVVFAIWFVFALVAGCLAALAVCPRCGNYFHVNGVVPLYLRKCLHCRLHLTADKRSAKA